MGRFFVVTLLLQFLIFGLPKDHGKHGRPHVHDADIRWSQPRLPPELRPDPLTPPEVTSLQPGDSFRECSMCPEMIVLPLGSFEMGSQNAQGRPDERPVHKVRISYKIAISRYELTFREWSSCVAHANCRYVENPYGPKHDLRPVVNVGRHDVEVYLKWLSKLIGQTYRLPSEAEWEYAARAGLKEVLTDSELEAQAWLATNSDGHSHDVGQKRANHFGLHDMLGNVWEWTLDCYRADYTGAPADGKPYVEGKCRQGVRRGGSWYSSRDYVRTSQRLRMSINGRVDDVGFRVIRPL